MQASKRKRYTLIACDECKRRKVKCDGQEPCECCARHRVECVYVGRRNTQASSTTLESEKLNEKIAHLQAQIDVLSSQTKANVSVPQTRQPYSNRIPPSAPTPGPPGRHCWVSSADPSEGGNLQQRPKRRKIEQYLGPTSSDFLFRLGRSTLQNTGGGLLASLDADSETVKTTKSSDVSVRCHHPSRFQDPLLKITWPEAIRLIEVYQEECGVIYPFLDKSLLLASVEGFFTGDNSNREPFNLRQAVEENTYSGGILDITRLVIAIASVIEAHGPTPLSIELLQSVEDGYDGRMCGSMVDVLELQVWTAMSILQFYCDEEALAWRTIGLAGRAAIEMGLHSRDVYFTKFHDQYQRFWANRLFWCIYVLDRRWAFGTGLSFAIPDHDIDPDLQTPTDPSAYLLTTMIAYARIGSKVWKNSRESINKATAEDVAFLDFQVKTWQQSIPSELRLNPTDKDILQAGSRAQNRLRILLYISANQMRLMIFRRTLLSPQAMNQDLPGANQAVDIAKDSIRLLDKVNQISDIYSSQQAWFNYFLVSALGLLFLAVCHGPSQFNESCREEFFMALELVRGFSEKSYVGKKLWEHIKYLKVIASKLGSRASLSQNGISHVDTHQELDRSTISEDSNLNLDHLTSYSLTNPWHEPTLNGNRLSNELTDLFETIGPLQGHFLDNIPGQQQGSVSNDIDHIEGLSWGVFDLT